MPLHSAVSAKWQEKMEDLQSRKEREQEYRKRREEDEEPANIRQMRCAATLSELLTLLPICQSATPARAGSELGRL